MIRSNLYDERFGDLRSLLGQRPSALGFARQCRALEQLWVLEPERVNQELVPYLERALEGWPAALRAHPMFWLRHWCPASSHEFRPVRLLRVLNLDQQRLGAALIEHLAALDAWHGLSSLSVAGNLLDVDALRLLATIPLTQLTHLNLSQNAVGHSGDVCALLNAPWAPRLTTLDMWAMGVELDDDVVSALMRLTQLERLRLSSAELSAQGQRALRECFGARVELS